VCAHIANVTNNVLYRRLQKAEGELAQLLGVNTLMSFADGTFPALAAGVRHRALYHIYFRD